MTALAVEAIEKLIGAPIPRIDVEGFDPVEWAEDDGSAAAAAAAPAGAQAGKPKAKPRRLEDATAIAIRCRKPRRTPQAAGRRADAGRRAAARGRPRPRRAGRRRPRRRREPRRERAARERDAEREPRRGEPQPRRAAREPRARAAATRRRRDERPRPRRDGRRRDDDLGPSVLGFGDDVPAFMLLRAPARAAAQPMPRSASNAERCTGGPP